ncbi:MAG: ATP-binding cassette domain-containing protein [Spirochaetia bacterium]|nr:ATP-binding cassette domain-containing protein [Spirochaetia bacterium]
MSLKKTSGKKIGAKTHEKLISFQNLGKQFDYRWAVRKASGEIMNNEYISLLGPNGAGKTTLLHLLTRLYKAHEGIVNYDGFKSLQHFYGEMDLLSHHSMFYPRLSAEENLNFFLRLRPDREIHENIKYSLDYTGLTHVKRKKADGFSRGMLQRLSLARFIAARPSMVFLDEPFTGLDLAGQRMLYNILKERGIPELNWKIKSFILVDHDYKRAYELSELFWLVSKGTLQKKTTKKDLSYANLEKNLI